MEVGKPDEAGTVGEEVIRALKRLTFALALLTLSLAGCSTYRPVSPTQSPQSRIVAVPVGPWRRFISTRGGYSIDFPGHPAETSMAQSNARAFSASLWVRGAEGRRNFSTLSSTFLDGGIAVIGPRTFLERLYQEVWAPKVKGRLIYKRIFQWNGLPTLEFRYGNAPTAIQPDPTQAVVRLFVSKNTVYDLTVIERVRRLATGDMVRFYNSFQLGRPPKPPKYES
jgi:hypothetical protein